MDDRELLNQYATAKSEDAFRSLVERYTPMVYQLALSRLGNPHQAEEVAQAVFIALARKAAKISRRTPLPGWLFQATRFAALNLLREETRRQRREQEAAMTEDGSRSEETPAPWQQISPYLNDALEKLSELDRNAILIRFFEDRSHKELGEALGVTEDAAKVRVSRAVEKLRILFAKKGIISSPAALSAALSAGGAQAAPTDLAASVSAVALAKGPAGTASVLATAKGIVDLMTWAKLKSAAAITTVAVVVAGIAIVGFRTSNGQPKHHAYTVRGNVELKSIRLSTNGVFYYDVETNDFRIYVKDNQWLVKLGSQRPEVYDYRVESSDGGSTYRLLSYETRVRMRVAAGLEPGNVGDGMVTRGNIPRSQLAPEAGAIWIAYASWFQFAESSSPEGPVPFAVYVTPSPRGPGDPSVVEHAAWHLDPRQPHAPIQLWYVSGSSGKPEAPQQAMPAQAFTNVAYQALSFMDSAGLHLPGVSIVSIYRRFPPGAEAATNQLCEQIRVRATNVVAGVDLDSFKPKLPGWTVIAEERFEDGTGMAFTSFSDRDWPIGQSAEGSVRAGVGKQRSTQQ